MTSRILASLSTVALVAAGATTAMAQDKAPIKIGILDALEGTYAVPGQDGLRGIELALKQHSEMAGGRKIETIIQSTDTTPDSALRGARKLVEQDGVDFVIGPLSGSEGIAIRDYSKTQPDVTFINGISGAMEMTSVDPSPNLFRFNIDGAQWSKGLGNYVYNDKGYKTVATIGEDYSFIYTQVFGFVTEFCAAGGEITDRFWVPLGTKDFGSIIAALPDDVDAIYLGLGGGDAVNFLNQYQQAGGDANLIGGTIMVDGSVLNSQGKAKDALIGVPSSGPQADTWDNPRWQAYVKAYQDAFPESERFPTPSLFATGYYNATNAALECLDTVGGDLSDKQVKFMGCLSNLKLEAPTGDITLDENRQAVGSNFVTEVQLQDDGTLQNVPVKVVENIDQKLGLSAEAFAALGLPSRENPVCKASY